jgi:lipoprotein-releasing system permease protein
LKLPFSLFLALRYLKPKRTFLSIITLISILGVMLGVTVLILCDFCHDRVRSRTASESDRFRCAHSRGHGRRFARLAGLKTKIDNTPGVVATAPYIQGPVIVEFQNRRVAPLIRGVDPVEEEKVIPLRKFIKYGNLNLEGDSTVLGIELARKLQANVGDKITVYSPGNLGQILDGIKKLENAKGDEEKKAIDQLREVILPKELTITGIFETGHYLHDSEYLLVPIYVGQELYGLGDALHGITVRTENPYGAERVKQAIEQFLEPPQYAQTWIDMNSQFFEAVRLERTVMFFLLFFIVVVAAFGIMSTLITVTVQKRREIGIVKALGANIVQIIWVFPWPGNNRWALWNSDRTRTWNDLNPLPQRVQSLARIDIAHRDLPARSLSIFVDSGGDHPERRRYHLHQRIFYLLNCRADSRVLRRAARSSEGVAL